jgi:hypothetical protein
MRQIMLLWIAVLYTDAQIEGFVLGTESIIWRDKFSKRSA